jgi:hypothetical protein
MEKEKLERECYEWQINNSKIESWEKKLKEELDNVGLVCIWQNQQENSVSRARRIIK